MILRSVRHRGLLLSSKTTMAGNSAVILRGALRNILAILIAAGDMSGVIGPPGWCIHQLRVDRARTWSISVTGNWRLTFDIQQGEICSLDLEGCH